MPRETRAFHPHRKLAHAGQYRQFAEIFDGAVRRRGHHAMKSIEQLAGFADRAALDAIRHQRRRRLRDGASRPLERDVGDAVVFNLHEYRDAVATEWIVALRMVAGAVEAVEVPRPPVVVEDDLLIQVGQIGHWISASSFPLPTSRSPLPASGGPLRWLREDRLHAPQ